MNALPHWKGHSPIGMWCQWILLGLTNFPISPNGGDSESKALDCWLITGAAGITGWSSSSSSLLTECNCVTGTQTVI